MARSVQGDEARVVDRFGRPVPATPVVRLRVDRTPGRVPLHVDGTAVSLARGADPHREGLAYAASRAARLGRPVRVEMASPWSSWPLVVHPDGAVDDARAPRTADGWEKPDRRRGRLAGVADRPRRRPIGALAVAATLATTLLVGAFGTGVVTLAAPGDPAPAECRDVTLFSVNGSGAGGGETLGALTDPLVQRVGQRLAVVAVPGPEVGAGEQQAVTALTEQVAAQVAGCPDSRIMLFGYSQGAQVAGDVAARIGSGQEAGVPADRVLAVGLFGDPARDPNVRTVPDGVTGQGVLGARQGGFGSLAPRTIQVCAPEDPVCATAPGGTPPPLEEAVAAPEHAGYDRLEVAPNATATRWASDSLGRLITSLPASDGAPTANPAGAPASPGTSTTTPTAPGGSGYETADPDAGSTTPGGTAPGGSTSGTGSEYETTAPGAGDETGAPGGTAPGTAPGTGSGYETADPDAGSTAPGGTAPRTTAPGTGPEYETTAPGAGDEAGAPGGTAPGTGSGYETADPDAGSTAPGGTAPGGTAPGSTAPGTTAPGTGSGYETTAPGAGDGTAAPGGTASDTGSGYETAAPGAGSATTAPEEGDSAAPGALPNTTAPRTTVPDTGDAGLPGSTDTPGTGRTTGQIPGGGLPSEDGYADGADPSAGSGTGSQPRSTTPPEAGSQPRSTTPPDAGSGTGSQPRSTTPPEAGSQPRSTTPDTGSGSRPRSTTPPDGDATGSTGSTAGDETCAPGPSGAPARTTTPPDGLSRAESPECDQDGGATAADEPGTNDTGTNDTGTESTGNTGSTGSDTGALWALTSGLTGFQDSNGGNVEGGGRNPVEVESPNVPGRQVVKLEVPGGAKRSEVRPEEAQNIREGQRLFFGYSAFLPEDFPVDTQDWQVIWQLHDGGSNTSPPVALEVVDGRLWLANVGDRVRDLGPVQAGQNLAVQMDIEFEIGGGSVSVYREGQQVLQNFRPPRGTMIDSFDYLKTGIYRHTDGASEPASLFLNDLKIGDSLASVSDLAGSGQTEAPAGTGAAATAGSDAAPGAGGTDASNTGAGTGTSTRVRPR